MERALRSEEQNKKILIKKDGVRYQDLCWLSVCGTANIFSHGFVERIPLSSSKSKKVAAFMTKVGALLSEKGILCS